MNLTVDQKNGDTPAADPAAGVPAGVGGRHTVLVERFLSRWATLIGFAVMFAAFSIAEPDIFPTVNNVRSIGEQAAPIIVIAVGLTFVLLAGEFDLSFPGAITLCSVLSVEVMAGGGGTFLAVVVGIAAGVGAGIVAGSLVAMRRAGSFITTLALSSIWAGLALGISSGQTISSVTEGYVDLTFERPLGIPLPLIYAVVLAVLIYAVIRWTVPGRNAQAVGSNRSAARLAGISAARVHIGAFAVMGACSGIAAVMITSRAAGFSPGISGGLFLPPFVAAFFGIAVLAASRFNVSGTVVGALFIGTLQTGLTIVGAASWVGEFVIGAVLLVILGLAAQATGRE